MAYNEALTGRVREALLHQKNVEEIIMFRGITFMVNGKMCISISNDRLMCRIDPALHDQIVMSKNCETVKMKNREYRGYVYISENELMNEKEFQFWINLALEFNPKAKATKKKK